MKISEIATDRVIPQWPYFVLFALSGFSGLVYESIWSHYLKLFLGHAAYAQSLVLIIFMGGLTIGSWIAAQFGVHWRRPILIYALVEGVIGLLALGFHEAFEAVTGSFYATILPNASGGPAGTIFMWLASGSLILPQTILLGMTFPLLTAGLIRRHPADPGRTLAMLYFTNSAGAAIGVLASGYWLIALIGLPGTIRFAGISNILLAIAVWRLVKLDARRQPGLPVDQPALSAARQTVAWLLVAAFGTGLASFIYQIGWIRMLSLVLGSATHSFELMLSAFIGGLALGGLWMRKRIDRVADPLRFAANVQVLMGLLAILSLLIYSFSFFTMSAVFDAIPLTDAGYRWFTLASHGIAMTVMMPTTLVAGMTLPLFTHVMMRRGRGERAIGQVYAANTLGGICGVLVAMHVTLPLFGLKNTIGIGALIDVGIGGVLFLAMAPTVRLRLLSARALPAALCITAAILVIEFDQQTLVSGVYRDGSSRMLPGNQVVYYRDGKTATVSVDFGPMGTMVLATNGKPDASIQMTGMAPAEDEKTMVMLAGLPLAYRPGTRSVAVIGFGSGLTAHTLLASPSIESVDIIEIEPAMVLGARLFGDRVRRAFDDSRSRVYFEDAKAFFAQRQHRYDVIISEPSNPWVSGVSSLFSTEFYGRVRDHLDDEGLLVQWVHYYELNDDIVYSILKALTPHFSDFAIYHFGQKDGAIVARKTGSLSEPDVEGLFAGPLGPELRLGGINGPAWVRYARMPDMDGLAQRLKQARVPVNSDYYPYVDLEAVKARFKKEEATGFLY